MENRTLYCVSLERTIEADIYVDAPKGVDAATVRRWVEEEASELLEDVEHDDTAGVPTVVTEPLAGESVEVVYADGAVVRWSETLTCDEWAERPEVEPDPKAPIPGQVDIFGGVVDEGRNER